LALAAAHRVPAQRHLDPRRLEAGAKRRAQPAGVEHRLGHAEHRLDEVLVEQAGDRPARRAQRGAHTLAELHELPGRHVRLPPADGIDLLEIAGDGVAELRHEPRRIDPRAQGRQQAARIVVAVVHARLVVERGAPQDVVLPLDQNHARLRIELRRLQRDEAPVDAAADDHVRIVHRRSPPARGPQRAISERRLPSWRFSSRSSPMPTR
jgi:hypothetical protein